MSSESFFNSGVDNYKKGDYEKSLQDFSKAIELNRQDSQAYYNRGLLLENHFKEYDKSLQDYSKAIELNPQYSDAYYNRGILLKKHFKEYDKSLQDYSKVIELNHQYSKAYFSRGVLLEDHFQEYDKSLQDYSKAIELNPQDSDAYVNRGLLLKKHFKEYDKSLQDYSKAIELNPQYSDAYVNRGLLLKNHFQEYDKSLQDYSKAIELNPQYSDAYVNRGLLLKNHFKEYDKSLQDYSKAIELNPQDSQAYYNRGLLLEDHFKEYDKSLQDYSKAIELNPQFSYAYVNRGLLLKNHFKDYDKSLQDYSKAIELNPQDSDAYVNRGLLLKNHFQEYDKSLQDYSKAIELNPQYSKAYYGRGTLLKDHFKEYEKSYLDFSKEIELVGKPDELTQREMNECQLLLNEKEKERVNLLQSHLNEPTSCSFNETFPSLQKRVEGKVILLQPNRNNQEDSSCFRVSSKTCEVEEQRFSLTHPTHSFAFEQKLDFDVSIGSKNDFASKFSKPLSRLPNGPKKMVRFEDLRNGRIDAYFESVLVDIKKDEVLRTFLESIRNDFQPRLDKLRKELKSVEFLEENDPIIGLVNQILIRIALFFIPMKSEDEIDISLLMKRWGELRSYLFSVREKRGNNSVYLGDLKKRCGACRHRSTLCKVVCDELGIRCRLICVSGYHAWNVIWIKDQFFIVDLMNFFQKGLIKLDQPLEYRKTKDSPIEMMSFLELQKKTVLDTYENRRKPPEYNSIMESLESLILEEEVRKQRELFFKNRFENPQEDEDIIRTLDLKKGGFGKITNFVFKKKKVLEDRSLVSTLTSIGESKNEVILFSKGQKVSVKQIPILEEDDTEEDEGEEDEDENVVNVTNLREGMERKYALKEKNFMRILDHPHIINSLGSFEYEDSNKRKHLCILMKSMEKDGKSFLTLLRRDREMSLKKKLIEVLYFLIGSSQGLQYMHRMNIIHMDFKLENVMVNWDEKRKEITDLRIIDFGGAKETDYRTSTVVFTTDQNDSPEVLIQKRRRNVKRTMKILKKMLNENDSKVDEDNEEEVNDRIDEIMACLVDGIPRKFKETPKMLALSLKTEIEFILQLERDHEDFVEIDENRKLVLQRTVKKLKKNEERSLLRFDAKADVYSFGKIIETILKNVKVPSSNTSKGLKEIVRDLKRIKNSCLKEKKQERPTMEGIMVCFLARLSLTVFPPSYFKIDE